MLVHWIRQEIGDDSVDASNINPQHSQSFYGFCPFSPCYKFIYFNLYKSQNFGRF